ncbi:hypothetical protein DPMN_019185 [Dreissena polymorpha]|uniref:Uncharacterized protein n=1 Tax=Dreissena polymorpha TaxID=45954 RepID=A0A9D4NGJ8_DREPO|nr:hypothetical protein DPMN_019185 [Dreissena polymorpha]
MMEVRTSVNFHYAAQLATITTTTGKEVSKADAYPHAACLTQGRPRDVEIDRIVIRAVQYQFEVKWCRNEEVNVKGRHGQAGMGRQAGMKAGRQAGRQAEQKNPPII